MQCCAAVPSRLNDPRLARDRDECPDGRVVAVRSPVRVDRVFVVLDPRVDLRVNPDERLPPVPLRRLLIARLLPVLVKRPLPARLLPVLLRRLEPDVDLPDPVVTLRALVRVLPSVRDEPPLVREELLAPACEVSGSEKE